MQSNVTDNKADTSFDEEKRVCQRLELHREVTINLLNGRSISGSTDDISLGGIRVLTTESIDDIFSKDVSQEATVQLGSGQMQESKQYPCTIVRHDENSVSLQMDKKKAASFSLALTRGSLKKK